MDQVSDAKSSLATFRWSPSSEFRPHWLVRGGHLQTIFVATKGILRIPYAAKQLIIDTTEDDKLVVHDDCPKTWKPGDACALLVHGLGGCHTSPYIVRTAHKLTEQGVRTFRMDMRGCGAGFRLAKKPGHAGRGEDVAAAAEFIARTCPDSPLTVVGYSLGGNIVLKWLGEGLHAVPSNVVRAMAVAPPIDLLLCSKNIEQSRMFLYNGAFVRMLLTQLAERRKFMPELDQLGLTTRPRSLFDFDDRVTAPLSGFSGAHEYYRRSSSGQFLQSIRVPTVILSAADDPIVPAEMFQRVESSPWVATHIARSGGHVGFFGQSNGDPDRYWLDWRVVEFVCES